MSLMQINNLSLLTYGALGVTGIVLAIATAYEPSENESPKQEESSIFSAPEEKEPEPTTSLFGTEKKPDESDSFGSSLFGTEKKSDESESFGERLFGAEKKPDESKSFGERLFGAEPKKEDNGGLFGLGQKEKDERVGGKKKKRRTKKRGGGIKKSGKTKRRRSKQKKSKKQ